MAKDAGNDSIVANSGGGTNPFGRSAGVRPKGRRRRGFLRCPA